MLGEVAIQIGIVESELLEDLKLILRTSTSRFRTMAFLLEYDGRRGWSIRPTSCVGLLTGDLLTLVLESRLKGLSTEKLLAMAQSQKSSGYQVSETHVRAGIRDDVDYSQTDLLGISLVDACSVIRRAGRSFRFAPVSSRRVPLRGEIDIQESIQTASLRPPVTQSEEITYSIPANELILAALKFALARCSTGHAENLLSQEVEIWADGLSGHEKYSDRRTIDLSLTYPREDYQRALNLACAILNNLSITTDTDLFSIPEVLVDIDQLFEDYCQSALSELLPPTHFQVSCQKEEEHPARPALRGHIKPDVVITRTDTGRSLVLDLKNKYSQITAEDGVSLGNADIYQVSYYALALGAEIACLIYPATSVDLKFPIKKSESQKAHGERVARFKLKRRKSEPVLKLGSNHLQLVPYQIDLGGSMLNTRESLAGLAAYIDALLS
jgi:hypothetical protein